MIFKRKEGVDRSKKKKKKRRRHGEAIEDYSMIELHQEQNANVYTVSIVNQMATTRPSGNDGR